MAQYYSRLVDPAIGLKDKIAILTELQDNIEVVHTVEYPRFLSQVVTSFLGLLHTTKPSRNADSIEQKLRNTIVEIIHRFPYNESLKPYVIDLMESMMDLLAKDNETNAVISLKIIVDLHKTYTTILEPYVQPFLDLVREMYNNMPKAVEASFDGTVDGLIPLSIFSFKVLTECPIIIALLFQLYRNFVTTNVPLFVDPIILVLALQPAKQRDYHERGLREGTISLGMSSDITEVSLYGEYKSLQVKTVSFLAYILRSFMQILKPYQDQIAFGVVTLMKDLSGDLSSTRKELLVAARHLWFTDFRVSFLRYIDVLLEDDVLVGTGVTCRETLKPLALSVLIDLLHNVRIQLTIQQIQKIILIYTTNLNDVNIPPQIQTSCVKLLLGLADNLVNQNDKKEARRLLTLIFDAFATRLKAMKDMFPHILHHHIKESEEKYAELQSIESFMDISTIQPIRSAMQTIEGTPDLVKDMKFHFKSVLIGIKACLNALRGIDMVMRPLDSDIFTHECQVLERVFLDGLDCFEYCYVVGEDDKGVTAKEDKEVVDAFASIFIVIDPAMFQEVCAEHIDYLFAKVLKNRFIIQIPQFFLANPQFSASFSAPLLKYLVEKFEDIGKKDTARAGVMLHFFKLLFMALSLFPDHNEQVFQPHLAAIIMNSLKMSSTACEPINYFVLLRGLFRSIGGGKFEYLYQEVLPLLQVLLETLNSLLSAAYKPQMRELFVELCLTVPVRLSVLLPHLSYLMRPLVIALHAGPELVSQSLKTLELCIDNLNHEFLEPIFAPVKEDLMVALWKHLHPQPYNTTHSHTTLRILGKFGGRNRRILKDSCELAYEEESGFELGFQFHGSLGGGASGISGDEGLKRLQIGKALRFAKGVLRDGYSKGLGPDGEVVVSVELEEALEFSVSCLPFLFNLPDGSQESNGSNRTNRSYGISSEQVERVVKKFKEGKKEETNPFPNEPRLKLHVRKNLEENMKLIMECLIVSATIPQLQKKSQDILNNLIFHFTLLHLNESEDDPLKGLLDAIITTISDERRETKDVLELLLNKLFRSFRLLLGEDYDLGRIHFFKQLALQFGSLCYQPEWFCKCGGVFGISILTTRLDFGIEFMLNNELEFTKALLYVLKDVSNDFSNSSSDSAISTLTVILEKCNSESNVGHPLFTLKFNSLVSVLIMELSSADKTVRVTVQKLLATVASLVGRSVTDILLPVKDRLLYPIFAKPLRALPFALQIGYIDAIMYGLTLKPPLVTFSDELGRLLHEALALADAEDQALSSKDNQYKNASAMNNLRVECIKLLSAVMSTSDNTTPRLVNVRSRIITLFFKCLYSRSTDVIKVANKGLTEVLGHQQTRLPKELLQSGLKPILVNLSDYKKLTVAGLQGLARLLELLTNYFKVEIGRKLIDHLRQWAEPMKMDELSIRPLADVEEIKIITAILDVFHLLPPAANVFLDEIINQVLTLEAMIRRGTSSPFRAPLLKFLNRYSVEACEYFILRLNNRGMFNLFESLLKMGKSALLDQMYSTSSSLTMNCEEGSFGDVVEVVRNSRLVYLVLSELDPSWIQREVVSKVTLYGDTSLRILITFCLHTPTEVELLLQLVLGFMDKQITDRNLLKQFVYDFGMVVGVKEKKVLVDCYLAGAVNLGLKERAFLLRFLIVPLLMLKENLIDLETVELVLQNVWIPQLSGPDSDSLRLEHLQLTTLILYKVPNLIGHYLKEVIKYAWNHLKIEDVTIKQSAYVLLCRFIKEFDTPTKIVAQTYVAQLKAHQSEIRPMVRQALDNLVPVLKNRSGMDITEALLMPVWVQWIRKIIIEDGHSVSQLVSVYQLLIRNPNTFYETRDHFMPQIVASLPRLGLTSNATQETKSLSLDLCLLVLKWQTEADLTSSTNQDTIIAYLIRFIVSLSDVTLHKLLFNKSIQSLQSFFKVWPHCSVSMTQLLKFVQLEVSDVNFGVVLNSAETILVVYNSKGEDWVKENISLVVSCVEKWGAVSLGGMGGEVCHKLMMLLSKLVSRATSSCALDLSLFKVVDLKVVEKLKSQTQSLLTAQLLNAVHMRHLNTDIVANAVKMHLSEILKLLVRMTEDPSSPDYIETVDIVIRLLNTQMAHLGELRKLFIAVLVVIIEQKESHSLHQLILTILRVWLFEECSFPTIKEKSNIAAKLYLLKGYGNVALYEEYMKLVADVYEQGHLNRTELTVRLQEVFLEGTQVDNITIRSRFLAILDSSLGFDMKTRLGYILANQDWKSLADSFWIAQALDLLMGAVDGDRCVYDDVRTERFAFLEPDGLAAEMSSMAMDPSLDDASESMQVDIKPGITEFLSSEIELFKMIRSVKAKALFGPMRTFLHSSKELTYHLWTRIFPICFCSLDGTEKHDTVKSMIALLAKDYHKMQASQRPNVVQALLDGVCRTDPPIQLPPQLVKYLGKTYNCWHVALEVLQRSSGELRVEMAGSSKDEEKIRESFMDALADLYQDLSEEDYFAGLWRRRCQFAETNAAISFEQVGMWQAAQKFYEDSQSKARNGSFPFSESEYFLWEKQWIHCTERLQQWDILTDLAKNNSNPDLLLECSWRLSDWTADRDSLSNTLNSIAQPSSPRKKFFQAFIVLNRIADGGETTSEFQRVCEEGMELVLKQWHALPTIVAQSHIQTFHSFQQFVELQEAFQIQTNLIGTNAHNIDVKSLELKNILSTWRDRLPNQWDNMTLWSDLVAWRQHVFTSINKSYLPLIPQIASPLNGQNPTSSYAYRGYHETAWIINRFAHVARKHRLPDVCISALSKIYTLPNIEIQEAFFKLREQAKCHKDVMGEYAAGLDVINNTNLLFFNNAQKADFFSLRGTFFAKLNLHEEAIQQFSSAIQVDTNLAHGWANYGEYNDRMFDEQHAEIKYASDSVNCYLHAATLFNSGRSRKYISRVLWLVSLDDDKGTILEAAQAFKPDSPVWYWITFIPELIGALAGKEAKFVRSVLVKIAKSYPQALHFQLRTAKEDFSALKRNQSLTEKSTIEIQIKDENGDVPMVTKEDESPTALDHIEEIMAILKTAYPLLALTMETMVDQILVRLKPSTDEDIYRLIVALLNDAVQMYISHLPKYPDSGGPLTLPTDTSLARFAESMSPNHVKYKEAFERDFITSQPNLAQLVERFRMWRDKLEVLLDGRPQVHYLEHYSQYLAEFEHSKFDDIEIPGQYFQMKNSSKDFARIDRFNPLVDVFRGHSGCHRRFIIQGHDGSKHPFIIQHPAAKQCRREERTQQLFRLLNETLDRRIESRRRNLQFHLPIIIPLAPQIRLLQDDRSNVTLQEIFEDHCRLNGFSKEDPIIYFVDRLKEASLAEDISKRPVTIHTNLKKTEVISLKTEIHQEIAAKMIPETIVARYFWEKMTSFQDLWTLRKRFTGQMACLTFMTYLLSIGNRHPQKFYISREKGTIWTPEFYSTISPQTFLFASPDATPFRLTPNLQHFMTPIGIEGLFTSSVITIAHSLSDGDTDLRDFLSIFIRDELVAWQNLVRRPLVGSTARLRELVTHNMRLCLKRTETMSCQIERGLAAERIEPVNQSILDLISLATNPTKLAQMDVSYLPQL